MKDQFTKAWIKSTAIPIIARYEPGVLTLRGLYYQLVSCGMTNSLNHYKRLLLYTSATTTLRARTFPGRSRPTCETSE